MSEVLNDIVENMLREHIGGEKFFDHLDEHVRKEKVIIDELLEILPLHNYNIIVSGGFGLFFYNYFVNQRRILKDDNIIVVNGSLRKNKPIIDLTYLKEFINDKEFIFVDDSFYSGKTRNVVKAEIERLGGKLINTYVVYDGSKQKDLTVKSLYRYYK